MAKLSSNKPRVYRLSSDEQITDEVKLRIEVIQTLIEPCDRQLYRQRKQEAAQKLGVSIRSIRKIDEKVSRRGFSWY